MGIGVFGAMISSVTGLVAQSQALGIISDNISNVNTIGYKTARSNFSTLVRSPTWRSRATASLPPPARRPPDKASCCSPAPAASPSTRTATW
jgi:flagellar basal body rod protein FlgG